MAKKKVESVGTIELTDELSARRIGTGIAPATRWPTEVWTVHVTGDPGASVNQFSLFKNEGKWYPWTGSIIRERDKKLARQLADCRNQI
jgi:hypothetical protein